MRRRTYSYGEDVWAAVLDEARCIRMTGPRTDLPVVRCHYELLFRFPTIDATFRIIAAESGKSVIGSTSERDWPLVDIFVQAETGIIS